MQTRTRISIQFQILAFIILILMACSEPEPTQIAVSTPTATQQTTATRIITNTATPTQTFTPTLSPTNTQPPSQTPTPTNTSTPTLTPLPTRYPVRRPIPSITPFLTVTPDYPFRQPKPVFLSFSQGVGDGIEMPYYITISGGKDLFIYADGQVVLNGYREGQMSIQQMCDLKEKITSFNMFGERESVSKTGEIDFYGGGYYIQFEESHLSMYGLQIESLVDEIAEGANYLNQYTPPVTLRSYQPSTVVVFVDIAQNYSWQFPEGGLTDDVLKEWPDSFPSLAALSQESVERDFRLAAQFSDELTDYFVGNYRQVNWYRQDDKEYLVMAIPLWPHETINDPIDGVPESRQRDTAPMLDCEDIPNFIDQAIPTVTPTLIPSARSYSGYGKLLFTSDIDGDDEIFVMNADGTSRLQLTNNIIRDVDPVWSPDGTRIAFTSGQPEERQIYIMDTDGSNRRQLTEIGRNREPSWSPNGSQIAFVSDENGQWATTDVYIINSDGSGRMAVTKNDKYVSMPAWSPDGRKIAYIERIPDVYPRQYNLVVVNLDGTEALRTQIGSIYGLSPRKMAWSPDSKELLLPIYDQKASIDTITIFDIESGERRGIFTTLRVSGLKWSRDGKAIVFSGLEPNSGVFIGDSYPAREDSDIFMFELETNRLTQITYTEQDEISVDWWQ